MNDVNAIKVRATRITAIGFDLDGTLFDHFGSARAGLDSFLAELGVQATPLHHEAWLAVEQAGYAKWSAGELTFQGQRRYRLRSVLPRFEITFDDSDEAVDDLFDRYLRHYRAAWRSYDGVPELLGRLRGRGLRLGILTNGSGQQQREKIAHLGLERLVDVVCAADDVGIWKPDPRAFAEFIRRLDVAPAECLFVGDHPVQDIEGATAAGMPTLLVDNHGAEAPRLVQALAEFESGTGR